MIIALTGNNGVGKDTVASIIQTMLNRRLDGSVTEVSYKSERWKIKKFADLPNELYTKITNVKFGALEGHMKEAERRQFIDFCQKNKEVFGSYIWVDSLLMDYRNEKKWIISDLRFLEEWSEMLKLDAVKIRIVREGYNDGMQEISHYKTDFTVYNNGDMIDLKDKVRDVLNQLELL